MQNTFSQLKETESAESFSLQNERLLKVELKDLTIQALAGSMVAYQGDVHFEYVSGGIGRFFKKAATGEGVRLMKVSGAGEVFLATEAKFVHLLKLENDAVTCNGKSILAFDAGIDWDINLVKGGVAGVMAGGLTNVTLRGSGWVAVTSDGPPLMLDVSEEATFVDPSAAVLWSSGVKTDFKADVQMKSLIGFGSGESIQMGLSGQGWVLVQPSEGAVPIK